MVAIICKRGILENSHVIQESLLRDVTQLLSTDNRAMVGSECCRESLLCVEDFKNILCSKNGLATDAVICYFQSSGTFCG